MVAKAYAKYLRISPRKVKIVADLIRGKSLAQATGILLTTEKLYVSEVFATPGPIIKRIMPRAQGRAYRINKRTSHVTLAVAEKE